MSDDTRQCNSCGTMMPADSVECPKCGVKQHTEPSTLSSFELLDDDDLQEMTPPAEAALPEAVPPEAVPPEAAPAEPEPAATATPPGRDSLDLEPEVDAPPEEPEIELEDVSGPPPSTPKQEESAASDADADDDDDDDDDESAQTGETVRMSMHDVVQAWNEEGEAETHMEQATTTLGEAEGLPKGFWPAIIACVLILASALVLLLG